MRAGRRSILTAGRATGKQQLTALGAVGGVAQEIQSQQRMIVKDSIRSPQHALAVSMRVPGNADSRLKIVGVGFNSFLQSKLVVSGKRQPGWGGKFRRKFDVIPQAEIQSEVGAGAERILPKQPERLVVETVARIAYALHQSAGYAKSEGLHPGKRRHTNTCWKAEGAGIKAAEVVNASIVHCEDRRQGQVIEVNPELGIVSSKGPRKVITELVSLLRSLNEGVRLPSDKCEPGNVGSYV